MMTPLSGVIIIILASQSSPHTIIDSIIVVMAITIAIMICSSAFSSPLLSSSHVQIIIIHDGGANNDPSLHLYRCTAYPEELANLIRKEAFGTDQRRDQPHWARKGTSGESWQGWVWSQGDGWFWTQAREWFELIPRTGRGSASASTPQSRAGYA